MPLKSKTNRRLLMASNIGSAPPSSGDPEWDQVVLSIHGNSGAITDVKGHTITVEGQTSVSTAQKMFGAGSVYFDGTDSMYVAGLSSDFALNVGDFTIEFWMKTNGAISDNFIIDFRAAGLHPGLLVIISVDVGHVGQVRVFHGSSPAEGSNGSIYSTTLVNDSAWHYVAVVRKNGAMMIFVDGVLEATSSASYFSSNVPAQNNRPVFGRNGWSAQQFFNGYLDDILITKGVARYIADFTPPALENSDSGQPVDPYWNNVVLGLHMDGLDNGTIFHDEKGKTVTANGNVKTVTATKKFGNSSTYFDGNGDTLTASHASDFNFGTGAFTIECWYKRVSDASYTALVGPSMGPWGAGYWSLDVYGNPGSGNWGTQKMNFSLYDANNSGPWIVCSAGITDTAWHHVAVTRSSNFFRVFLDGQIVGSGTHSGSLDGAAGGSLVIGSGGASNPVNAYIDDFLVTKGVARYTANFDVPTRAFPRA